MYRGGLQGCGVPQEECMFKLSVHHRDGDKKNCDPKNLISLCKTCHGKVHFGKLKHRRCK